MLNQHAMSIEPRPETQALQSVVAPISSASLGKRKSLASIVPSAFLSPCTNSTSTLTKLPSSQAPSPSHEFPSETCSSLNEVGFSPFDAAIFPVSVATAVPNLNPIAELFHAVFRLSSKFPGCELSVNPSWLLLKAMEFVITWFAGPMSASSPPPSLKPLPSPSKGLKSHLFYC